MTMNTILATVDPDITERLVANRREFFRTSAIRLGALASAPMVLALASQQASLSFQMLMQVRNKVMGAVDELRISNVARSSSWIDAQHRTMTDAFITFATQ